MGGFDLTSMHAALVAVGLPAVRINDNDGTIVVTYSRALTGPEQTTADAITASLQYQMGTPEWLRSKAKKFMVNSADHLADVVRAVVLVLIDEINILRLRDRDRSTDVAAATSLADLKTRWAARSQLNDRTGLQAKSAINIKLDAGEADS